MKTGNTRSALLSPLIVFVLSLYSLAQPPSSATVTFTLDFPGSTPEHYSVAVESSGQATYTSSGDSDSADPGEPFHYSFTLSGAARAKIFDLAARAHYFEKDLDYGKHALANTGAKTLAYKDAQRNTHSTFNYTTNVPAQQLTTFFQGLATTLEFGRRLQFCHQYQKLALDDELKRMETLAKENQLDEIQSVAPILKRIAADPSVINQTRARAERLLAWPKSSSSN
jgi:hypothetical protein